MIAQWITPSVPRRLLRRSPAPISLIEVTAQLATGNRAFGLQLRGVLISLGWLEGNPALLIVS